jgi:predicted GTPase
MSRWRLIVLASLIALPILFVLGEGFYFIWQSGWSFWVWWPISACFALAWILGWHWQRKFKLLRLDTSVPLYWTDRDREAWRLVEGRAKAGAQLSPEKLTSPSFYLEAAQEMGLELARFYHPKAQDPVGSLTIPEILAVVELAAHDLAEMVDQYLPGGHLLTVNDMRRAKKATEWYQAASKVYWLISSVFSPVNTAVRYLASEVGMSRPLQALQQNLILWFYSAYVHRLGTYLIELNSGRVRVGATRYRQLLLQHGPDGRLDQQHPQVSPPTSAAADGEPVPEVRQVTLTVMGQVKAGKSSFINALLGEQRARTDVIPATAEITRYELHPANVPNRLVLLDTVGYGHTGPKEDQLRATEEAARQSDLLILVLHATNPAWQADLEMLQALKAWFEAQPHLKIPPILGVMTHIDLLSPKMEWAPPYHIQRPVRLKEKQIAEAVDAAREQLGKWLVGVVPVCCVPEKVYGIDQWFLPALAELLDQAHAVAFLRCLRAETDLGKVKKVFHQLLAAGKEAVRVLWEANAR